VIELTIKNEIMLITYADSLGDNLNDLNIVLKNYFNDAVGSVHILPFFPSSADRGFAPITYQKVADQFGSWRDIASLEKDFDLMFDFMINHISSQSDFFHDFIEKKNDSDYADFFVRYQDFWPDKEPTQAEIDLIYKRKPRAPFIKAEFSDGTTEKIWCTFAETQIDLNMESEVCRNFIKDTLLHMVKKGAAIIRLDAFAYATKKPGTNCFFVEPDVWELLEFTKSILAPYDVEILPEIHEHYTIQHKLAEKGYWIYDFALPMIMLHTLYSGNNERLINWLQMSPAKQFTTLDTHDGIGVVDVKGLMTDQEIEKTRETLYQQGSNVKKVYSSTSYGNLDIYQINCTYYSALGNDDAAYLLARAIQFFAPGIPQVYYVGILAGENDIELLEETKEGRNINRHFYSLAEIEQEIKRPVVQKLIKLMEFRNSYPAFAGDIIIHDEKNKDKLKTSRKNEKYQAVLEANLKDYSFSIRYFDSNTGDDKLLII